MITDTQDFIRSLAARGIVRFNAAPVVTVPKKNYQDILAGQRLRRHQRGCKEYKMPFKGRLPKRSDPGYSAAYNRMVREAEGIPANAKHPELNGMKRKERNKIYMRKWRSAKKGKQ